jgi:hypothetical protein
MKCAGAQLNRESFVVTNAGHLLVDEEPELTADMVAGLT